MKGFIWEFYMPCPLILFTWKLEEKLNEGSPAGELVFVFQKYIIPSEHSGSTIISQETRTFKTSRYSDKHIIVEDIFHSSEVKGNVYHQLLKWYPQIFHGFCRCYCWSRCLRTGLSIGKIFRKLYNSSQFVH